MPTATPNRHKVQKHVSVHDAVVRVLGRAHGQMTARQVIDRVMAMDGVELKGLTPRATISAQLSRAVGCDEVKRPSRGVYVKKRKTA